MENQLVQIATSQGIWAVLSVFLIFYHKNLSVKFLLRICYKFITSRY